MTEVFCSIEHHIKTESFFFLSRLYIAVAKEFVYVKSKLVRNKIFHHMI